MGLTDIHMAAAAGLASSRELADELTASAHRATEALAPVPSPAVAERPAPATSGLAAAVQRQVASERSGLAASAFARLDQQAIMSELRTGDRDSVDLGLAKAVARQCVREIGVARSGRPIAAVRALAAGGRLTCRIHDQQPAIARGARVLGVAPRR